MRKHAVKITAEAHAALIELAKSTGKSMSATLSNTIHEVRRSLLLRQTNEAYQRLRQDSKTWEEESHERRLWENASVTLPRD